MKTFFTKLMKGITLDKAAHFFASGWIFFALIIMLKDLPLAAFGTLFIGFLKELYDQLIKKTGMSFVDMAFNLFGVFFSVVIYLFFNN